MKTINAKDTGSLNVGLSAGSKIWAVGDKVLFAGETTPRTVTYVMGAGEKTHLCFKGQGPVPLGEVEFSVE